MGISYYDEQGRITGDVTGDEAAIELTKQLTTLPWVDGDWLGKPVYVLNGVVTDRPVCPAVLNGLVLSNLPVPCVLDINGTQYNVDQSEVTLDLGTGHFVIKVIAFPYLDGVFNVDN